jgi:hypothetical protein
MAYSKLENGLKYKIMIRLFFFRSRVNTLVYIYVPNEFVIGQVVLKACHGEQGSRDDTTRLATELSVYIYVPPRSRVSAWTCAKTEHAD